MTRAELYRRFRSDGWKLSEARISRVATMALHEPSQFRPAGRDGHRIYSEMDYRKMVSWLRVNQLLGSNFGETNSRLRSQASDLLATETFGYVYISDGVVGWTPSSRMAAVVLRSGNATCWPVWD